MSHVPSATPHSLRGVVGQPVLPAVVAIDEDTPSSLEAEFLTAPYGRGSSSESLSQEAA